MYPPKNIDFNSHETNKQKINYIKNVMWIKWNVVSQVLASTTLKIQLNGMGPIEHARWKNEFYVKHVKHVK